MSEENEENEVIAEKITSSCNCHRYYTVRHKKDPDCNFHEFYEDILEALDAKDLQINGLQEKCSGNNIVIQELQVKVKELEAEVENLMGGYCSCETISHYRAFIEGENIRHGDCGKLVSPKIKSILKQQALSCGKGNGDFSDRENQIQSLLRHAFACASRNSKCNCAKRIQKFLKEDPISLSWGIDAMNQFCKPLLGKSDIIENNPARYGQ